MKCDITSVRNKSMIGMTMLEAIMALMVLAVGMTGAVTLIMASMRQSGTAQHHYVAANLCKDRLERARVSDFTALSTFAEDKVRIDEIGSPVWNGKYRRTTLVSNVTANLKEITVFVEILSRTDQVFGGDTGMNGADGYAKEQECMKSLFADFQEVSD